jgi:RHO1 GDP-GTP exchange protein 1/2
MELTSNLVTALHEPFVLAFEPTFVEIRDINTGSLVQVIQGSNLRLLFADAPPSVSHPGNMGPSNNGYSSGGYQPAVGFNGPNSYGGYGAPMQHPQGYARQGHGFGRDEILVVSDDRVLALRIKG